MERQRHKDDFDVKLMELFNMSPLIMLDELRELVPLTILFHLKNLYLRFNLFFDSVSNENIYNHLNNFHSHDYMQHLMDLHRPMTEYIPIIRGLYYAKEKANILLTLLPHQFYLYSIEGQE
jgi:hypothetical protein